MKMMTAAQRFDPRLYQIAALGALLTYGVSRLAFDVTLPRIALTLLAVIAAQWTCSRICRLPVVEWKSAMISGLSLCLLFRTDSAVILTIAAFVTIASKFLIRVNGKHIFNPTNGGIIAMLLLTENAWVSPGQWGSSAFFGFGIACAGSLVVSRAARADTTFAFLFVYAAALFSRAAYLGDPAAIPLHKLQNGALLLFAFFMISDPKTTPNARSMRILYASLVALGAVYIQVRFFRSDALLWSLAVASPLVPLFDSLVPAHGHRWRSPLRLSIAEQLRTLPFRKESLVHKVSAIICAALLIGSDVAAFCGFYVAKADTQIFNRASQVVLVHDDGRTVITMANDFEGDPREFAVVIPVPTLIERKQINVADKALIDHLDAYTSPRLVEYFDEDPCEVRRYRMHEAVMAPSAAAAGRDEARRAKSLGVTIEASYTVGEYDIIVLSAKQSGGLETWLRENGYRVPKGASAVLGSYIRQNMRFFVAKVNLEEQSKLGFQYLRPIQVAYTSKKFMLPIRLGTVNAKGTQELFVYTLTRNGRVEATNYRTVKLPSDQEIPTYVKGEFPRFYKAMFSEQVRRHKMSTLFLEYAWDMGWCDPCAADPLSNEELRKLGVFWIGRGESRGGNMMPVAAPNVFVTRLHVRYDGEHFPEDLVFHETGDRTNFQARYVLRHPWTGRASCDAGREYKRTLTRRHEEEIVTLAKLTGWKRDDIRRKMNIPVVHEVEDDESWWEGIWEWR